MSELHNPAAWDDRTYFFRVGEQHGEQIIRREVRGHEDENLDPDRYLYCVEHDCYEGPLRLVTGEEARQIALAMKAEDENPTSQEKS